MSISYKHENGTNAIWEKFHAFSLFQAKDAVRWLEGKRDKDHKGVGSALSALTPFLNPDRKGAVWFIPGKRAGNVQLLEATPAQVHEEWEILRGLHANRKWLAAALKFVNTQAVHAGASYRYISAAALPSPSLIKRLDRTRLCEIDSDEFAQPHRAFAVWMAARDAQGYLSDKKTPVKLSGARLFESEAAAVRTANAIGAWRHNSGMAIVEIEVEVIGVAAPGGAAQAINLDPLRKAMASWEVKALRCALVHPAGLDHVVDPVDPKEPLEPLPTPMEVSDPCVSEESASDTLMGQEQIPASVAQPPAKAHALGPPGELGQAGTQEAWAMWMEVVTGEPGPTPIAVTRQGFHGFLETIGPLSGALLFEKKPTRNKHFGRPFVAVRVRAAPVRLGTLIGCQEQTCDLTAVEKAIDRWHRASASQAKNGRKEDARAEIPKDTLTGAGSKPASKARRI